MDIQWATFDALRGAISAMDKVRIWVVELEYEELNRMN